MQKKKLLVVKMRKTDKKEPYYGLSSFNMAWVSNPKIGRYQASGVMTCREYFCDVIHGFIYKTSTQHLSRETDSPIDLSRTRVLILNDGTEKVTKEKFKESLFNGKALLNVYEKLGNFSSISKITTVKHEKYGEHWLITGPPEWMKAGQLVSAMTFLLRLATYVGPIDTTSINTVEDDFKSILLDKNKKDRNDVADILNNCWDKLWVLVKFQNELFSENLEENYKNEIDRSFGICCGISSLVAETSNLHKFDKTFKKLCEEHLPRKK